MAFLAPDLKGLWAYDACIEREIILNKLKEWKYRGKTPKVD